MQSLQTSNVVKKVTAFIKSKEHTIYFIMHGFKHQSHSNGLQLGR